MTKAEKIAAIKEFNRRIREEQGKGSKGAMGKWVDFYARDFLMADGVGSTDDIRCRSAEKTDFRLFYDGRYHNGESKTAAGSWKMTPASLKAVIDAEREKPANERRSEQEIRDSYEGHRADITWTEDEIFPNIELFVIAAETEFLTEDNYIDQVWVCNREQYLAMHRYTGSHGISSSLTYDPKKGIMKIQPYVTKTFDKKYNKVRYAYARVNKFYEFVEQNDLPTLREFREKVRG